VFLEPLVRRNPDFVAASIELHQDGQIPAGSYVLDLDSITANARTIADEAQRHGMRLFGMTKQFGRNAAAMDAIAAGGIDDFVAVDMWDARAIRAAGHRLGHIGHLVQVPVAQTDEALSLEPEFWTVFSVEKARAVSDAVARLGATEQRLLLRVHDVGDEFYSGHEGGIPLAELVGTARVIEELPGVTVAGVTTFPALLYDAETRDLRLTPNASTLARASERLRDAGWTEVEVNGPGTTASEGVRMLAAAGVTQAEPGHGLTGTTPLHAVRDAVEVPALLYLTEVSHHYDGRAYCVGGGFYIDPVFPPYDVKALVGGDAERALSRRVDATLPPPAAIDYYGQLHGRAAVEASVGESVIFGFRAQAFFRRGTVVALAGAGGGDPAVAAICTTEGHPLEFAPR
jgi:predicted amino acid racemase